jgi:RNA-directed DNA polymerase
MGGSGRWASQGSRIALHKPRYASSSNHCSRQASAGFVRIRPKRGTRQAIYDIRKWVTYGYDKVIDLDLKSYFDTIDHELLMKLVQKRARDVRVLRLLRRWLRAGVMLEGYVTDTVIGAPQGAVISPLLSNIYLHPLDLY